MSWTNIEDALYQGVVGAFPDIKAIIAYQNGHELVAPYCLIDVLNQQMVGREQISNYCEGVEPDVVYTQEVQEQYEVLVRFTFIGKDDNSVDTASNTAHEFYSALNNPLKRYYFALQNLAVMRKGNVKRSPIIRDTKIYNGYSIDVTFSYCLKMTETGEYFDTVEISGELSGSIDDPLEIEPFTVPS